MEQTSFLSSLPFLIPLHSKAWPPSNHNAATRVLNDEFEPFVFSVELTTDKEDPLVKGESIVKPRTLYFAEQSDPTFSPIQIYVGSLEQDSEKEHVYFKTKDCFYLVDTQKVKAIAIQYDSLQNDARTPSATSKQQKVAVKLPPSLVIRFPVCQFRIFRNRLLHCNEDRQELRSAGVLLSKASFAQLVVPRHVMASPARASHSCSTSNSHRNESLSSSNTSHTTDGVAQDLRDPVASNQPNFKDKKRSAHDTSEIEDLNNGETGPSRTDRCIKSRKCFHDRLHLISHALRYVADNPLEAPAALLSHTADCLADSFINSAEFVKSRKHNFAEASNQEKMDAALTKFFPDRSTSNGITTSPSTPQEAAQTIRDLLQERNEIMKKQCEVLTMPIRG